MLRHCLPSHFILSGMFLRGHRRGKKTLAPPALPSSGGVPPELQVKSKREIAFFSPAGLLRPALEKEVRKKSPWRSAAITLRACGTQATLSGYGHHRTISLWFQGKPKPGYCRKLICLGTVSGLLPRSHRGRKQHSFPTLLNLGDKPVEVCGWNNLPGL